MCSKNFKKIWNMTAAAVPTPFPPPPYHYETMALSWLITTRIRSVGHYVLSLTSLELSSHTEKLKHRHRMLKFNEPFSLEHARYLQSARVLTIKHKLLHERFMARPEVFSHIAYILWRCVLNPLSTDLWLNKPAKLTLKQSKSIKNGKKIWKK